MSQVKDLADGSAARHPLAGLPREWAFPGLPGYREGSGIATYYAFDLDDQPPVAPRDDLAWLEGQSTEQEWNIAEGGDTVRPLTADGLDEIAASLAVPSSLRLLASRPDLQRRIRSATACYLDLGDFAPAASSGGRFVHVLSDQQWCLHWLVYVDAAGNEAVVTSPEPVGFDLPGDWPPLPDVIPVDGDRLGLRACADSFTEFIYRFWAENEIFFAGSEGELLAPEAASYAASLGH